MRRPWPTLLLVSALATSGAVEVRAEPPRPAASRELPPLPPVPATKLPEPTREEIEQLDASLAELTTAGLEQRRAAASELRAMPPRMVSAIELRMKAVADRCDREAMKAVLGKVRREARAEAREELKAEGTTGKVSTPDYLDALVVAGKTDSKAWLDLVSVVGLSRALGAIGTVEAVRELIEVYTRFGEFLRVDTQLALERLGDRAVPALIEARRHKAEKIVRWAERQLDALGKAIPSEAVQTTDHQVLADILRAYGRVRDPDAARIAISFASSERAQVRDAARQSVALMGEVANWQLRDSYETVVGRRAPRDWSWDRTARELFAELDGQRLAQVHRLFEEGVSAREKGDLEAMRKSFDQVLARNPLFERAKEMAAGYEAFAQATAPRDPEGAIDALRRAERITTDDGLRKRALSLRLALEAQRLSTRGLADQELLRRALDLDPTNATALGMKDAGERGPDVVRADQRRWVVAGIIGVITLIAMAAIALLPRVLRRSSAAAPAAPEPQPASAAAHASESTPVTLAPQPLQPVGEAPPAKPAPSAGSEPAPDSEVTRASRDS